MNNTEHTRDAVRAEAQGTPTLAPWTYFAPEFYELEVDALFKPSWMFVGHTSEFKNTGDYLTFNAFDEQAIVVRDADGKLNAFHNVCQHRGGRVLTETTGNCRQVIMCPFHGWSYGLDGCLKNVPAANTFKDLDIKSISLSSIDLEIWLGFVFIRFKREGDGQSLSQMMAPIESEIRPYRPEELVPFAPGSVETKPYNWKTIHDIDNEGYHVPVGHPSLQQLYGQNYSDSIESGFMIARGYINESPARLWSVKNYQALLPVFDHLPKDKQRQWFYLLHFPNLVFGFYPDMMEIYMTIPDSAGSTRYVSKTYALPDDRREARASRYLNVRINDETAEEDETFVGWMQEGMKSSAWKPPRLSELESGVQAFHQLIQKKIPVANLLEAPNSGEIARLNAQLS